MANPRAVLDIRLIEQSEHLGKEVIVENVIRSGRLFVLREPAE